MDASGARRWNSYRLLRNYSRRNNLQGKKKFVFQYFIYQISLFDFYYLKSISLLVFFFDSQRN